MNLQYPPLMGGVTGIELGAHSCLLVRVYPGPDSIRLTAIGGTGTSAWEEPGTLLENLRRARRGGFPRHATIVDWNLRGAAFASDPFAEAALAPFRDAGFVIDSVLTPPEALCLLAERRSRAAGREGEVWLALNRDAVAIAIIDDGRLLYSRTFDWQYRIPTTAREELLQRYSLVAHLAPEVSHGIDVVRTEYGTSVNAVITCGDLPDLRSLTMPLIEELDIEVETLDTLEGIRVEGNASGDAAADRAPALRLACAAAAGSTAARPPVTPRVVAAAAIPLVLLGGGWLLMRADRSGPLPVQQAESRPEPPPPNASPQRPAESATKPGAPTSGEGTAATTGQRQGLPAPQSAEATATATSGQSPGQSVYGRPRQVTRDDAARTTRESPAPAPPTVAQTPRPLAAPLPVVNSILVAPDRRLAVLNGEIVREGQSIGPRVLVRIEPNAVVLREPSGYEVRVAIRRKLS
jgi:hypothetical protein